MDCKMSVYSTGTKYNLDGIFARMVGRNFAPEKDASNCI